jgi:Flp pilus assembly secretin CpaC
MAFFSANRLCGFVAAFLVASALSGPAAAADIYLTIDQAQLVKLPERAETLVIGNPLIADASVQSGGLMVITGKGFGATNVIALDRSGAVLMERIIEVGAPPRDVFVYRGVQRETYSCAPDCEARVKIGDSKLFFETTLAQTAARNSQAQGIATSR